MSRGAMPASSQAARIASSAMSYSERPSWRANGVCPMPTIAARSRMPFTARSPAHRVGDVAREAVRADPEPARQHVGGVGTEAGRGGGGTDESHAAQPHDRTRVLRRADLRVLDADERTARREV